MALRWLTRCIVLASYLVSGESLQYGGQGLEIVLTPDIPGQPESILWKHNGDKVVEFDGSEERAYDTYTNRVIVDWVTAELTIKGLRREDSGRYDLEIEFKKRLHHSNHMVEVIDQVAEPTVSCVINDTSSSNSSEIRATLMCTAEPRGPPSLLRFEWRSLERVQPGPGLLISLGGGHDDAEYTCTVSNPVSQKTTTFPAKNCNLGESTSIAVIVSVAILSIVLFVVAGLVWFYCYKKRSKAGTDAIDEEKPCIEAQGSGGSAHGHAALSPNEIPEKGYVSKWINILNSASAESDRTQTPSRSKNHPAKKRLFSRDAPADTETGAEEKSDEDREKEPLLYGGATLPSTQPLALYAPGGQNMVEDTASEREEDADQVTVEPAEKKPGFEEKNEPDSDESEDPREEKESNLLSSPSPVQPGSDPTPPELESSTSQEQTNTQADTTEAKQREMDIPASEQNSDNISSSEEIDEKSNVSPNSLQQPQTTTQADTTEAKQREMDIPASEQNSDNISSSEEIDEKSNVSPNSLQQPQTTTQADTTEAKQREMDIPASEQNNDNISSSEEIDEKSNVSPNSLQQPQTTTQADTTEAKQREMDIPASEQNNDNTSSSEEIDEKSNVSPNSLQQPQTTNQADTTEAKQREMDIPASEQNNDNISSLEEIDEKSNVSPNSLQQPQSPTPTIPDNPKTFQDQPGAQQTSSDNHLDPKLTHPEHDSKPVDESEEHSQTDLYTAEPGQDESQHEVQTPDEKSEAQSEDHREEDTGMDVDQMADTGKVSSEIRKQETEEEKEDTDCKDASGEDLKDKANEDQDLNKEVPLPEKQDGEMDSGENEDAKTNGEARKEAELN